MTDKGGKLTEALAWELNHSFLIRWAGGWKGWRVAEGREGRSKATGETSEVRGDARDTESRLEN